jgi:ATP-dependent exoDNAse (exonuclease V) beta subunit
MLVRFAQSDVAARLGRALAAGADVRREVAFHARVRFPAGAKVGPFEALLVKGTIDLWLPDDGEVRLVDHKTNAPSREHPTPASLAAHYAWQLRLYALAAERLLGRDVSGASLLLLDPGWGPEAVEVPVDVSGPGLEEARRLCQAFARAELEDRWPADWRALLSI